MKNDNYLFELGNLEFRLSHGYEAETYNEKVMWFSSLSICERLAILNTFMKSALKNDPSLIDRNLPTPIPGKVRIIELPSEKLE